LEKHRNRKSLLHSRRQWTVFAAIRCENKPSQTATVISFLIVCSPPLCTPELALSWMEKLELAERRDSLTREDFINVLRALGHVRALLFFRAARFKTLALPYASLSRSLPFVLDAHACTLCVLITCQIRTSFPKRYAHSESRFRWFRQCPNEEYLEQILEDLYIDNRKKFCFGDFCVTW